MGLVSLLLMMILIITTVSDAVPWRRLDVQQSQVCGDKLADMLSLICSGRGYNFAFKPEGRSARRFRRGIVEECCHKSCTPAMLELYCRPDTTEPPSNVQIRKRDSGIASTEHQSPKQTSKTTMNKSTPNDTMEDESFNKPNIPPLRHHKGHHKRKMYNHKASTKSKRDKNFGGITKTFEIGTMKPYFVGRAFATYRSRTAHPTPLS